MAHPRPKRPPAGYATRGFRSSTEDEWDARGERPAVADVARQLARLVTDLVRVRQEQGCTQQVLARRCGVSRNAIAELEAGTVWPSTWLLMSVAEALGVDVVVGERRRVNLADGQFPPPPPDAADA